MHKYSILIVLLILFFNSNFVNAQQNKNQEKPNIIFILTDDQRFDAIGYAGNKYVQTPEMDKLASSGTYFSKAIATTPICAASRASILTGLHERSHNYNFQTGNIRADYMENSYPKLLKNNGYYTGFYGKFGVEYSNLDSQFDVYDSYDRNLKYKDRRGFFYKTIGKDTVHLTRYTGQQALDFINTVSNKKPFCLSLSFSAPHAHDPAPDQYFWQPESDKLLANTTIPDPTVTEEKYFKSLPKDVQAGFNRLRWTWRFDTPEKYQKSVKGYYRMISEVDSEIKKIREKLAEKGLDKNTIIIVMGDNGYFLGERQLADKWLMYDNSIRVPMIIYDPRVNAHQDIDDMALNIDIPATIADYAGIAKPASWQGKSLKPITSKETKTIDRDTILIEHIWEFTEIPPSEGVRTKKWKYFRYVNDKSIEELYNLEEDPKETKNLINDKKHQKVVEALRKKCDELIKKNSNKYRDAPRNLTVELIRDPSSNVTILDTKPEFGWTVDKESKYQLAYQIVVASNKTTIDNNIGDIWNSKQVRSNASTNVEYGGAPLEIGKKYFWKVRIWDDENRLVDYSVPQQFTIGKSNNDIISTENTFQKSQIKPVNFEKRNGLYFIDFGRTAFATLNFTYKAKKQHTLSIRISEQLENKNGSFQEIKVTVTPGKSNYQLALKPNPSKNLPEGVPVLMPFRYVEIEGAKEPITASDVEQIAYYTYWDEKASSFTSDNAILNQVWDISKYSIRATSLNNLYADNAEQDTYIYQLSHYATDSEYAMARRTIENVMQHKTLSTKWQPELASLFYADYMYTGNTELIKKYYEELKSKTLFELSNENGLANSENSITDLFLKLGINQDYKNQKSESIDNSESDGFVLKPYNIVVNAFFYENMKMMTVFAKLLGNTKDALDFEYKAARIKKAINEQMFDTKHGVYLDGIGTDHASLHANMMCLAFGLVPNEYEKAVIDFIKTRGMACSVYGSQFLLNGLYNAGEADYALKLLTSSEKRSWYKMIQNGQTIATGTWNSEDNSNSNSNPAWGTVPANVILRGLWGIKPKTPGFSTASIKPQMGSLKSSEIEYPTVFGIIKGKFTYNNARLSTYEIEIPANMVAKFSLKDAAGRDIILNGEKVSSAFETIQLTPGKNTIELKINSF